MNNLNIVKEYFAEKKMVFKFNEEIVNIDKAFANDGFAPGMIRRLEEEFKKFLNLDVNVKIQEQENTPLNLSVDYDFSNIPKSLVLLTLISSLEAMAEYNDNKYIDFDEYLYD
jgi:hypothetical protein